MVTVYWKGGNAGTGSQQNDPDNINNWVTTSGGSSTIDAADHTGLANGTTDVVMDYATSGTTHCEIVTGSAKKSWKSLTIDYHASLSRILRINGTDVNNKAVLTLRGMVIKNNASLFSSGFGQIKFTGVPLYTTDNSVDADLYIKIDSTDDSSLNTDDVGGMFYDGTGRKNLEFVFEPPASTTLTLQNGIYPNMDFDAGSNTATLSFESLTDISKTNRYPCVSMLNLEVDDSFTVSPRTYNFSDKNKHVKVRGTLTLTCATFNMGLATFELIPVSAGIKFPVTGSPTYGVSNNFNATFSDVIIGTPTNQTSYVEIEDNTVLSCEHLHIKAGGRLYGPIYGSDNSAEIHTTKAVTLDGDWNFSQKATGVYRTTGTQHRLNVSSGGTGLNTVPVNALLYGANRGALGTLALGTAGKVLAVNSSADGLEWSATAGGTAFAVSDITGATELTSGLASTDELVLSDGGVLKRMDISVLQTYMQSGLTFTTNTNTQNTTTLSFVDSSNDIILRNTTGGAGSGTDDIKFVAGSNITLTHTDADNITISSTDTNTDVDVSVANLKTRLAGGFGSNAVTIGDVNDVVTIGHDLVVTTDLQVGGGITATAGHTTLKISHASTETLRVEQDGNGDIAKFYGASNELLTIRRGGTIKWGLASNGASSAEEPIMTYSDTAGNERNFMAVDDGTIVLQNRGPSGNVEIRANSSTAGSGGEVSVADFQHDNIQLKKNTTITGNLTINGTTTTVNTATLSVEDPLIILASGNNAADTVDIGFYGLYDTSGSQDLYAGLFRDANDSGKFKLFKDLQAVPTTTVNTSGTGYAVGTLVADIEGAVTGNASTATLASTVTLASDNGTESHFLIFSDAATGSQALKTDDTLTYIPSSGRLTTNVFVGDLAGDVTGDVTGNVSGTAATVTGAAQSAITSLGTLTALTGGTGDLIWDTNTLVVDSSEDRVGIGINAPEYKLDVQDGSVRILPTISSNAGTAIRIGARGNGNDITLLRVDGNGSVEGTGNTGESNDSNYGFSLKYMGSGSGTGNRYAMFMDNEAGTAIEAMSILQDGKVGIGTTAPSNKLHLALSMADGDDGILLTRTDSSTSQNDILGGIGFDSSDGNIPSTITEASVALVAKAREDHSIGDKGGYLDFYYTPSDDDDDTTSRIGMRMMQGKLAVGGQNSDIGDPINSLVVEHAGSDWHNGILVLRDDTSISDGDLLGAIGFDGKDGNNPSNILEASAGIAAYAAEDHGTGDKGGDLAFFTTAIDDDDDTTSHERMRITSEGNVGIGDTSPDFPLEIRAASTFNTVNGHIMLTGDSATNGQGPQIVFSESGSSSSFAGAYVGHVRTGSNSTGDLVFGTRATGGDATTVPTERLRITSSGSIQSSLGNLNTCVAYVYNRSDMNSNAVNLKAVSFDGSSSQNHWGYIMPKSGTVKYFTINTRNHTVTSTNEQTWKINNNNDNSSSGEFFQIAVAKGATQDNTGVSGDATMELTQSSHSSTIWRGAVVVNHTFDALDEIRIQRTNANSADMGDTTGVIYVEFD